MCRSLTLQYYPAANTALNNRTELTEFHVQSQLTTLAAPTCFRPSQPAPFLRYLWWIYCCRQSWTEALIQCGQDPDTKKTANFISIHQYSVVNKLAQHSSISTVHRETVIGNLVSTPANVSSRVLYLVFCCCYTKIAISFLISNSVCVVHKFH